MDLLRALLTRWLNPPGGGLCPACLCSMDDLGCSVVLPESQDAQDAHQDVEALIQFLLVIYALLALFGFISHSLFHFRERQDTHASLEGFIVLGDDMFWRVRRLRNDIASIEVHDHANEAFMTNTISTLQARVDALNAELVAAEFRAREAELNARATICAEIMSRSATKFT